MMEVLYHNSPVMAVAFINQGDIEDVAILWYVL
jgi:hypothetical protein